MSKKAKKAKNRYTKKQLRRLETEIRALAHELRHTPVLDPALARKIAFDLRIPARAVRRTPGCSPSASSVYRTARVVRGAPVPR